MGCPLLIPPGTISAHNGVRIAFVEPVNDIVLRYVHEGTTEEFYIDAAEGVRVRPTVKWVLDEFAAGRLVDCATSASLLSEWRGRYLGLDREAVMARDPGAVLKYEIALAALIEGLPRSAQILSDFARKLIADDTPELPSGRTIIRAMNNLQIHGEKIGAMVNRSGREKGRSQLPAIVDRLVQQGAALFYSEESLKKMDAHALVVSGWRTLKAQGVEGLGKKAPPKTTVINRINRLEGYETTASKVGIHQAARHFLASGETVPVTRPFELAFIDGTEFEQACLFSSDAQIATTKMKVVQVMDAFSLFAFPTVPFGGPYRSEMGMNALLGALTAPTLDEETMALDPMRVLYFGKLGRLRGDNDRAILPPSAIGNLASVITRVELSKKYGPDEKSNVEHYFGVLKGRMDGLPGTVLSPRSRKRSIRRDPLAEAAMTRASFARKFEELRLEWNDTGHEALGGRTPNEIMREYVAANGTRFQDPGEVRRSLARTVPGVLTTDGVVEDGIRYRWNRTGITKLLSENLASQAFASRLEGTARCEVWLRVYDWNLDFVEVFDEANNDFVKLWSDDPDYTQFLTRYEHKFHTACVHTGATGAQTLEDRAARRAKSLYRAWEDMHNNPFGIAKKAAAVLERAEVRAEAKNLEGDPDLTDFTALLIGTDVGGQDPAAIARGPSQSRGASNGPKPTSSDHGPIPDWGGLDPEPRSTQEMLDLDRQDDLDDGINWDTEQ